MSKAQEEQVRGYVAKKLEIAVDECADLLGVTMDEAQALLDGMGEYVATPKGYRGVTSHPNVYHAPLPPDPRDKGDGTKDQGYVIAHNTHRGEPFAGVRAGGDE